MTKHELSRDAVRAQPTTNREPVSITGPILVYGNFQLNCQVIAPPGSQEYEVRIWVEGETEGLSTRTSDIARAIWMLSRNFLDRRNLVMDAVGPDLMSNSLLLVQRLEHEVGGTQSMKMRIGTPTIYVTEPKRPEPQNGLGPGNTATFGGARIGVR